ncbi:MAG: ATP-binding protein [Deltaproteobacteria bacterium]|jgi:uncharacterized protein|nr:ATP-binding protein [Deltaproteobacteria bacterium]MBT3749288.1 ATP-binding protein [Bacteroidota bacterium]MBT4087676.1 ATP-binding protein [Deltaproteobacteria bacterium]MBT4267683.1 ATP-binding protein [Deltaproteobacteria bacterium]MBT4639278.1 ATP-binding protein [Deltaproteobacteria bacterium]
MYQRMINLESLLKKKSFFLFGPRSTGKTTLIENQLNNCTIYDLLDAEVYRRLLKRPKLIDEEAQDPNKIIVIDEVQKIPSILDEVHRLVQKRNLRFLLTGSSARKLKRGAANLLAGRAWRADLFPLSFSEVPDFNLLGYLNTGGLPQIYNNPEAEGELESYVGTYLKEEIQAEALTRNIEAFAEFLDAIALSNGKEINYESLASDCQVSTSTLKNYIQVLEDTLIGFRLPGFRKTKIRKAISRSKHYLFDIGVVHNLCQRSEIKPKSELFGEAFEHFIILETRAYNSYKRRNHKLSYWRSTSQMEVDLLIGQKIAIEIKGSSLISEKHLKGLRALKEEGLFQRYIVVSLDPNERKTKEHIEVIPWKLFLEYLWQGKLF